MLRREDFRISNWDLKVIRTLFLLGRSDIEEKNRTTSSPAEGGGYIMTADLTGVLPIFDYVMNDRVLRNNSEGVLLGVSQVRLQPGYRVNLFNLVGDADSCKGALHDIQVIANRVQPQRLFNHPNHVFRTSRARLPKTLADIPGCIVPRVEVADVKSLSELRSACESFDCWPLIIRARGYHGGQHMLMLNDASDIEAIEDQSWLFSGIFLIEFIDCKGEDGLYHKTRMIMVDGVPHPRHSIISDRWAIHSGSRVDLMDHRADLRERERELLADLQGSGMEHYSNIFQEIYLRIGLDIFGIDFSIVDDQVVVFEANACMSFLGARWGDGDEYEYLDAYVDALRKAVRKLLLKA